MLTDSVRAGSSSAARIVTSVWRDWIVWTAVAAVVLVRLPLLNLPAWADEAGFLMVGGNWHLGDGGSSLYGDYWVDRPPVLITLYGLAERLGGIVPLRLLGALAAVLVVLAVADLARTLTAEYDPVRAARWASITAAALLCTPYHWNFMIDGDLLASPFVAWAMALAARALLGQGRSALVLGACAGALAMAAMLTKQNFADAFVFALGFAALMVMTKRLALRGLLPTLLAGASGAVAAMVVTAGWTLAHGTSLGAVWYALFQFRVDAAQQAGAAALSISRLEQLNTASLLSGLAILILGVLLTFWRKGRLDPAVGAMLLVLVFDLVSVAAGTNYWLHYLVQPSVPVAVLVGLLIGRGAELRPVAVLAVVMSLVGTVLLVRTPPQTAEEVVGRAIGRSAEPGDDLVTVLGRSNVNLAAGLPSPYPYLWSLPAQTLDPGYRQLKQQLSSYDGPVWVVSWRPVRPGGPPYTVGGILQQQYREVARICGHPVYLRMGLDRPVPVMRLRQAATRASACQSVTRLPAILRRVS